MDPEFSIIIPTYNRSQTLGRAIDSVLSQNFSNFEILIVDDGSTDQTKEMLTGFKGLRYFYQSNRGVGAARNRGAAEAQGKWLLFLDSDDEMENAALEVVSYHLFKQEKAQVLIGSFQKIQEQGSLIHRQSAKGPIALSGTYVIRRDLFLEIGGFDEQLTFSENSELIFRIKLKGIDPVIISEVMLKYYPSESGGSRNMEGQVASLIRICEKHKSNLTSKEMFTYKNILGVLNLRLKKYKVARSDFFRAVSIYPLHPVAWGRLILSVFPPLAKFFYS